MNIELEKNRKKLEEKGLITGNDASVYNEIYQKYKNAFEMLLSNDFKLSKLNEIIESSNLYFSPSVLTQKIKSNIATNYLRCLNTYYIDKLTKDELKIIKENNDLSQPILEIVKKTYKDVLKKDGVKTVMYNPPTPERMVENGTLVLELSYGTNTKELPDDEYISNMHKQKALLTNLVCGLEQEINMQLGIKVKILIEKRV